MAHDLARSLRGEWVIGVRGVVKSRGGNKNPKLATGEIEVHVVELSVFNKSETPPFEIVDAIDTSEEKRLQHRYLDLRRAPLQKTLTRPPPDQPGHAPLLRRARVSRARDAGDGQVHAGGREELPRAVANARWQVLRARREPAALQAALHGGRVRQVLPDRQVLPRRGPAPRPPARVHADRRRDVVRQPGRRLPHHRGARLPGLERGPGRRAEEDLPVGALSADAVRRVDARLRQRQAGPTLRAPARRPYRRSWSSTAAGGSRSGRPSPTSSRAGEYRRDLPHGDREGAARPGAAREHAVARGDRQARGVRQGHGREGTRAGEGRWPGPVGAVAVGQDDQPRSCARRSTPGSRRKTGTSSSSSSGARPACRR